MKAPSEKKGSKTIEVRVHFWTNGIAAREGEIKPGHCLASGSVSSVSGFYRLTETATFLPSLSTVAKAAARRWFYTTEMPCLERTSRPQS